jgi:hypothetical protein
MKSKPRLLFAIILLCGTAIIGIWKRFDVAEKQSTQSPVPVTKQPSKPEAVGLISQNSAMRRRYLYLPCNKSGIFQEIHPRNRSTTTSPANPSRRPTWLTMTPTSTQVRLNDTNFFKPTEKAIESYSRRKMPTSTSRYAIVLLVDHREENVEWRNILHDIDRYYPFDIDVVILFTFLTSLQKEMIDLSTLRKTLFVNVSEHWDPKLKNDQPGICKFTPHGDSYFFMIRFMAGPVYWLDQLKEYDYIIRYINSFFRFSIC